MSRLSFCQSSRDQAASDPTIFTSPHYHSRKLFFGLFFVQTVNNIHKSFDEELVSAARNIRCIIEKAAENLVTEVYPDITWLVSQLRATCYLWYIFAFVKTDLQTGYPVIHEMLQSKLKYNDKLT